MNENELSHHVIGAAIEVHRFLGPGLLESVYQQCLALEFDDRQIPFQREVRVPLNYKGRTLGVPLRLDFLVGRSVVIEIKSARGLLPVHKAQMLTYLRLTECRLGLLINFTVPILRQGLKRIVNKL